MKYLILAAVALALASPAVANGDVTNDNGDHIGVGQDCDGSQCDIVNDNTATTSEPPPTVSSTTAAT